MVYIFTTRRLGVRRFCGEDLAALRAVMRDADSQRFLSFSSLVKSKAAARQLLVETIVAYDSPEPRLAYAVELRTPATFIGLTGISRLGSSEAEIMYAVAPRHRGRGLATELAAGLISYARDVLGFPVLVAFVVPDNERSKSILRGLGFHGDALIDHPAFAEPVERFVLDESADG